MEDKMREEFESLCLNRWHIGIGRSETFDRYDDDKTAFAYTVYQAGRNHPIEISLEEAVKAYQQCLGTEERVKAVLSLVPNVIVKE